MSDVFTYNKIFCEKNATSIHPLKVSNTTLEFFFISRKFLASVYKDPTGYLAGYLSCILLPYIWLPYPVSGRTRVIINIRYIHVRIRLTVVYRTGPILTPLFSTCSIYLNMINVNINYDKFPQQTV